jgi:hypothetical protein
VNVFGQQQWLIIALVFFGFLAYVAWVRRRDHRWIEKRYGKDRVRAISFGVNYFGLASEPGGPRRSSGFLLLLPDRLVYRSRVAGLQVEIPRAQIVAITHDRHHKGVDLHQSVLRIDFRTADGHPDSAAFKVPYPPQWIRAIQATLCPGTTPD